jgi:protoporphyrinogen oxidase
VKKEIRFADGQIDKYDELISTIPVDRLCNDMLNGEMPRSLKNQAASLRHSGGYMVGIGIKQPCPSTKSWMYFPETNCPFYRATYLSNYSPYMTPDNNTHYSLLCETSYSEFKPVDGSQIVEETIQGLVNAGLIKPQDRKDIVDTWVYNAAYSYPTPTVERDEILAQVIPYLESNHIYSRGRFGMWKYEVSNTDHSLMQGVELVNRLLLNEPETTIGMKYASTGDGRNAAVHERSLHAGSGEKRNRTTATVSAKTNPDQPGDIEEAHVAEEELGIAILQKAPPE